ncbi:MAG: NAD(P)-dependent alcohol dehydrogenase [Rikenellaceae bacterium]|nr:NAD(P)-dependent alcohol dehydrogenase [Rikenellaceae bacterium]
MKIQAAVLNKLNSEFDIEEIELDEPRENEVLVKVIATGLCHSDVAVINGYMPIKLPVVLGHEGAGIVEKVGSGVTKVKPGDHVILAPASCGVCEFCLKGHPSYCKYFNLLNVSGHRPDNTTEYHINGKDISGHFFYQSSFATYSLATERNVIKIQDDVPTEMMGPLGCGLQTGSGSVLNVINPSAGETIVVSGVGPVGLAGIMAAKAAGCTTIIAIDVFDTRLEKAKELGATHTFNSKNVKPSEEVLKLFPDGIDYAFDTTSLNEVINDNLTMLKPMSKCILVGIGKSPTLDIDYVHFENGKNLEFAIEGDSQPDIYIPRLIELYKKGMFPFDKLVTYYDFKDINKAVKDFLAGKVDKAIIRMPQE